jgi:hypothetical protein
MKKKIVFVLFLIIIVSNLFSQQPISRALRSAVIPGWGELSMGNKSGYVFLVAEAALWSSMFYFQNESDLLIRKSHQFALNNADLNSFENIDARVWFLMSRYNSSGFDVGGYNHSILMEAMELFPYNADRRDEFIRENMLDEGIHWNWESRETRRQYQHMIRDSGHFDDYAKVVVGVIMANHMISFLNSFRIANRAKNRDINFFTATDNAKTTWVNVSVGF